MATFPSVSRVHAGGWTASTRPPRYTGRPVEQVVDRRMLGVYRTEHLSGFLVEVGLPSVLDVNDGEHDAFGVA